MSNTSTIVGTVAAAGVVAAVMLSGGPVDISKDASVVDASTVRDITPIAIRGIPIDDLRTARLTVCPTDGECDGGYKWTGKFCRCYTTETDPLPNEVELGDIPASQQYRLVGICEGASAPYNKMTQWIPMTEPIGTRLPLYGPVLISDVTSTVMDHGHVDQLNSLCCDPGYEIARPGDWDECPECIFACNPAGVPNANPGGCDSYCYAEAPPP